MIFIIIIIQKIPCSNFHHYIHHHMCRQWVCYATVPLTAKRPHSRLSLSPSLFRNTANVVAQMAAVGRAGAVCERGSATLPAAMNIRAKRGSEWPAPDINRGINTLQFNLLHLFLWGLDFAPLCPSQNTV